MFYLVRTERVELSSLAAYGPKPYVSASSTTSAYENVRVWRARQESNLRPSGSKPLTLSS